MKDMYYPASTLAKLVEVAARPSKHRPWLPRDPSAAMVVCIGAGPWKFARRQAVQRHALECLQGRDLTDVGVVDWFPLDWQNSFTATLAYSLRSILKATFAAYCAHPSTRHHRVASTLGELAGCSNPDMPPKVLSLFVRDYLELPCFPIDRHVRRQLLEEGLPTREYDLVEACRQAGVSSVEVSRRLGTERLDGGNPDFTAWGRGTTCQAAR